MTKLPEENDKPNIEHLHFEVDIPEYYADRMRSTATLFGLTITFGISEAHPDPQRKSERIKEQVRIRTSLQHAKLMIIIMKKQLQKFEKENDITIDIPENALNALDITEKDWQY